MKPKPKALRGFVKRIFAPPTKLVKLDSPYNRPIKGASGKYAGITVNVSGTTIGFRGSGEPGGRQLPVSAVQGRICVARTTPGKMLPTGEPTPGKAPAAPKLLVPPNGGPNVALKPGKPNVDPAKPGPKPKFGPWPPVNG